MIDSGALYFAGLASVNVPAQRPGDRRDSGGGTQVGVEFTEPLNALRPRRLAERLVGPSRSHVYTVMPNNPTSTTSLARKHAGNRSATGGAGAERGCVVVCLSETPHTLGSTS
jgi:hypothetical protein